MNQNPDDIRLFPEFGFLIYADGYTAQIIGMKPGKDQQDNDVWDIILLPSKELVKRYKLKPKSGTEDNFIYTQQLPYDFVIQLNADPSWTRWFYLRTYDGNTVPSVEMLSGSKNIRELSRLKSEINELRMKLDVANEKSRMIEMSIPKYLKKNFEPVIEQFIPLIDKLAKKQD